MRAQAAHERGEAFLRRDKPFERPLCLLAHHDDEIGVAGLLQRLGSKARVVWLTNSDGRYFDSDLEPAAYAQLRKAEGLAAVGQISLPAEQTGCLDFSEVDIYRHMSELHTDPGCLERVRPFFEQIRQAVRQTVFDLRPDLVITLAWQGGQPEHDLTHFFTHLALVDLEKKTVHRPTFLHFPAYEYTYALAMRFHPLYRGQRLRLQLSGAEMERKRRMIEAYPSQVNLFRYFRWAFALVFFPLGLLTGGPRSLEQFLAIEEFGPVPRDLDYSAPPHIFDKLTYMFDDFEGVPVTYRGSIQPLVRSFLGDV